MSFDTVEDFLALTQQGPSLRERAQAYHTAALQAKKDADAEVRAELREYAYEFMRELGASEAEINGMTFEPKDSGVEVYFKCDNMRFKIAYSSRSRAENRDYSVWVFKTGSTVTTTLIQPTLESLGKALG